MFKIQKNCMNDQIVKQNRDSSWPKIPEPWHKLSEDDAAVLLKNQSKFEDKPEKREPLHHKVIALMWHLLEEGNNLGFWRAIWLWTALAHYGASRRQNIAMEKKDKIQVYVKPNGELVVRAFTLKNLLFLRWR